MPIYAYRCSSCGHAQDVLQRMSDPVLSVCPSCGASSFEKQVTAAGFQLKGSGWYVTDFRGGNKAAGAKKDDEAAAPAGDAAAEKAGEKSADKATDKAPDKSSDKSSDKVPAKAAAPSAPAAASPAPAPAAAKPSGGA